MTETRILTITGLPDPLPEPPPPAPPTLRLTDHELWLYWVGTNTAGAGSYAFLTSYLVGQLLAQPDRNALLSPAAFFYLGVVLTLLCIPFVVFLQGVVLRQLGLPAWFWTLLTLGSLVVGTIVAATGLELVRVAIERVVGLPIRSTALSVSLNLSLIGLVVGYAQGAWLWSASRDAFKWSLATSLGMLLGGICVILIATPTFRSNEHGYSLLVAVFSLAYSSVTGFALRYLKRPSV